MLSGTSTIRAFGTQNKFFNNCQRSFDKFNALFSAIQHSNFWLGLRLDALGGSVGAIIGAVALATKDSSFIPAGWVGLALSYSIEVTGFLKHGVRMIAQVEAEMNSVERVLYYSNNIETEADLETKNDPKPADWPTTGEIAFQNMSMRYRDGPLVLKDVSVSIKGGEKIGVCGRTGSGKSSLVSFVATFYAFVISTTSIFGFTHPNWLLVTLFTRRWPHYSESQRWRMMVEKSVSMGKIFLKWVSVCCV